MSNALFSKQHYEFVAALLRANRTAYNVEVWEQLLMHYATTFKRDNPRFSMTRFMQACGLKRKEVNTLLEGAKQSD